MAGEGTTRPVRRLVIGVGLLIFSVIMGAFVVWGIQTHALGEALIADTLETAGRSIERDAGATTGAAGNGYECLAAVETTAPSDLSPFELDDRETLAGLLDAGVLPEPWLTKMKRLEPWATSVRNCGNSDELKFVDGVITPFKPFKKPTHTLALAHMTQLQVRLLGVEAQWEAAAELCAGTIAVTLDRSHVNLYEAWLAGVAVEYLLPYCGEALLRLPADARVAARTRFAEFPGRLVPDHELVETDRQVGTLNGYAWLLTSDQLSRLPHLEDPIVRPEGIHQLARALTWSRHDRAMRGLVEVADSPGPSRLGAGYRVASVEDVWWLPGSRKDPDSFLAGRLRRNDVTAALLHLLVALADGGAGPFPPQVTRTSAGIEFSDDGRSVEPGWSHEPVTVVVPTL